MKKIVISLVIGSLLSMGLMSAPSMAKKENSLPEKVNIIIEITVEKKTLPEEKPTEAVTETTELVVDPGDILIYQLTCINKGGEPATEVLITDPIPEGSEYIIGSATGDSAKITFSIDGGNIYQDSPVTYKIRKSDGTIQIKLATPDMFTHIRWLFTGEIMPQELRKVSFEVKVK